MNTRERLIAMEFYKRSVGHRKSALSDVKHKYESHELTWIKTGDYRTLKPLHREEAMRMFRSASGFTEMPSAEETEWVRTGIYKPEYKCPEEITHVMAQCQSMILTSLYDAFGKKLGDKA